MNSYGFMPHGYCFEWRPSVLWLHILSDLGISISYFGIAFVLFYFVRKRPTLPFQLLFWLFSTFIALCGTTHAMSIWVLWHPNYFFEGYVKAATAVVSVFTLLILTRVIPKVLYVAQSLENLVSTRNEELAEANKNLREQIESRERVEMVLRQTQKMQAVGQLSGGIAHDFNNMLQAIGGNLELLRLKLQLEYNEESNRILQTASDTIGRASALTSRLLSFARLQPLIPRPVNLGRLVSGMQELINTTIKQDSAPITLQIEILENWRAAYCDSNQLENALLNLVINARDAMPFGGILSISTKRRTVDASELMAYDGMKVGDYIEIEVADTGFGMDEETVTRVFEPFFSTKPPGRGTGLGLSMVYGFINQSGGFISIESAVGKGTKVRLFLQELSEMEPPPPRKSAHSSAPVTSAATVLVVEDEAIIRNALADYLRAIGYSVLTTTEASEALEIIRHAPKLDILVTDIGLPNGMNGRQLADATRELRQSLPVLLVTGFVGTAEISELPPRMKIIGKPFSLPLLATEIANLLQ